jgi:hypothetical protein
MIALAKPLLVCLGAGSEYALAPLAREARQRGLEVIEIDMYEADWRQRAASSITRPFVLATSHHPYLDGPAHRVVFGCDADLDKVSAFVARERPQKVFFIPHDLSEHLHPEEFHSLHLFDALLMPNECHWFLRPQVRVEVVGWIKSSPTAALPHTDLTLLPSEVAFYGRHPDLFRIRFAPVLSRAPRFKVARFFGSGQLEEIARSCGCEVVPCTGASTDLLMATSAVVSNALSSIVTEAASLGVPTLCLMDDVHPALEQQRAFGHLPGVALRLPAQSDAWLNQTTTNRGATRGAPPPFDFDRALAIIYEA